MKTLKQLVEAAKQRGLTPTQTHRPLTRRDLVAQGLAVGYGTMMTPGVLSYAAECSDEGSGLAEFQKHMIYGLIEMPGGCSITKYFHPTAYDGSPLSAGALNNLAVTRTGGPFESTSIGLPSWTKHAFFMGFWLGTTPEVRANMNGFAVASTSNDDSAANMHIGTEQLIKLKLSGALAKAFGTSPTKNGARSATPLSWVGGDAATQVTSPATARGLMEAVALANALPGRGASIVAAARKMSESRLAAFSAQSLPQQIRDLITCNYVKAEQIAKDSAADSVDYTKDTQFLADLLLSLNVANNPTPPNRTPATPTPNPLNYAVANIDVANSNNTDGDTNAMLSQLYLALTGNGNILNSVKSGGYDYHQNAVATNNQKDFNVGLMAGRFFSGVHYYHKARPNLAKRAAGLTFVTDGAAGGLGTAEATSVEDTTTGDGDITAGGDRGEGSGGFCMFYTPNGRLSLLNPAIAQINGWTTPGGGVEKLAGPHTAVADSPANKLQAMLMNLMAADGLIDPLTAFPEALSADYILYPKWRT